LFLGNERKNAFAAPGARDIDAVRVSIFNKHFTPKPLHGLYFSEGSFHCVPEINGRNQPVRQYAKHARVTPCPSKYQKHEQSARAHNQRRLLPKPSDHHKRGHYCWRENPLNPTGMTDALNLQFVG
jgi:hypothetical protein